MLHLIDNANQWWRLTSVQLQLIWGVMCQVYVIVPREDQIAMLNSIGLDGVSAAPGMQFLAQVSVAVAAATIAARVTAQPKLQPPPEQ